jgi:hypothetical protein
VFTARYALSPYIKQIRFVFKGLRFFAISPSRPSLLWDVARCRFVGGHRHFGTTGLSGGSSSTRRRKPETSHLHLGLANGPFPSGFRAKILYSFLIYLYSTKEVVCQVANFAEGKACVFKAITHLSILVTKVSVFHS